MKGPAFFRIVNNAIDPFTRTKNLFHRLPASAAVHDNFHNYYHFWVYKKDNGLEQSAGLTAI
jgi:hypothetical protein